MGAKKKKKERSLHYTTYMDCSSSLRKLAQLLCNFSLLNGASTISCFQVLQVISPVRETTKMSKKSPWVKGMSPREYSSKKDATAAQT